VVVVDVTLTLFVRRLKSTSASGKMSFELRIKYSFKPDIIKIASDKIVRINFDLLI